MLFAVRWPNWWLWYSHDDFDFDRAKALLNLAMYPQAWFERQAQRMANSSEVTLFMISFDALRMKSGFDLCLRMAMNFSFSHRLNRVVEFMIQRRKRELGSKRSPTTKQQHIRRPAALVFLFVCIGVLLHTNQSIVFLDTVCAAFPQCVAYAYRWSKTESCPCRALIDVDKAPRAYGEWIDPLDATELVRRLTNTGDLRVVEITNRRLDNFPDELRHCTDLQSITLMYTGIQVLPDWATRLSKLEYLSIEGRSIDQNLITLPDNLFDHKKSLTFLHLGVHQKLTTLPRMTGLTNLKALSVALLLSLKEIPSLLDLHKLKRVLIEGEIEMNRIPNLSHSVHIDTYAVGDTRACCNGYIGPCDLSHYLCATGVTCLDKEIPENQPNAMTQQLLDSIGIQTCKPPDKSSDFLKSPSKEDVDTCEGKMYKQCFQSNSTGMCYSTRMQVIACQNMKLHEVVRRKEIQKGIGLECDPVIEKWLGCGDK